MSNFYKYLPVASEDLDWGIQVLHAGFHHYEAGSEYPDRDHPTHHRFDADRGRILEEYSWFILREEEESIVHPRRVG